MKKILITCYAIFSVLCLWASVNRPTISKEQQVAAYYCMLKEYDGRIGIYAYDDSLMDVIDYPYLFLNDYDRKALDQGVIIQDERELRQRIEDYTS